MDMRKAQRVYQRVKPSPWGKVAADRMRGDVIAATRYRAITESLPLISPLRGQLSPLGEAFSLRSILQSCANFGTLL